MHYLLRMLNNSVTDQSQPQPVTGTVAHVTKTRGVVFLSVRFLAAQLPAVQSWWMRWADLFCAVSGADPGTAAESSALPVRGEFAAHAELRAAAAALLPVCKPGN